MAPLKAPRDYRVVGTSVARKDIPGKVLATTEYCHHVHLPDMLHGRVLRPASPAPCRSASTNLRSPALQARAWCATSISSPWLPETEWDAIRASRQLAVKWSEVTPPFPAMSTLFDHIRTAPRAADSSTGGFGPQPFDTGPALAAIAGAARQIEAEYEVPFQSHARMAPSVGVADVKTDEALVFSDTQKPHDTRTGIAKLLGLPADKVRVVWKPGSGSYGRSDADEAAYEAALLSKHTGRPVRVQWMRHEGHGWDPKAPACVIRCKAGLDAQNAVAGWYLHTRGFSGWDVYFNASDPKDTLVGQLTRWPKGDLHNFGVPAESYEFPDSVRFWETIPPLLSRASPLRCSHMRAPQEPQLHFAQESFVDEVAAAGGIDPIAMRLRYLQDPREIAVLEAVARASGWQPRTAARNCDRSARRAHPQGPRCRHREQLRWLRRDGLRSGSRHAHGPHLGAPVLRRARLRHHPESEKPAHHHRRQHRAGRESHAA